MITHLVGPSRDGTGRPRRLQRLLSLLLCVVFFVAAPAALDSQEPPAAQPVPTDAKAAAEKSAPEAPPSPGATEIVDAARNSAQFAAWEATSAFRRARLLALRDIDAPPAKIVETAYADATAAAAYESRRSTAAEVLARVVREEPPAPVPVAKPRQEEDAAVAALEQAKQREAEEKDAALRALRKREREIAEQTLAWTRQIGARLTSAAELNEKVDAEFTAQIEPLRSKIATFSPDMLSRERQQEVDPVLSQLVDTRRRIWSRIDAAGAALQAARDELEKNELLLVAALEELDRVTEEPASTQLATQRVTVAEAHRQLAEARVRDLKKLVELEQARFATRRAQVDDLSLLIRNTLPHVSSSAERRFYDIFNVQNWRDASNLVFDKFAGWQDRIETRAEEASSIGDQIAAALLWIFALLPRLLAFALAAFVLRFVPPLMRRFLDWSKTRPTFRRHPTWAIKFYELVRRTMKPLAYLWAAQVVFDFVAKSFAEVAPLWGAIEAIFVFWIIDRAARTLFLSRARRDTEGRTSVGGIDDLTMAESLQADLFLLKDEVADRAVRSVRIIIMLIIAWTWVLDLLYAFVGRSVISYLVRIGLIGAIGLVVFWALSAWREEIATLFGKLAGSRVPTAQAFVNEHKDRFYGVAVIAVAAIVVLALELSRVVRTYLIGTEAFRRWNNFLFAKKIELQAKDSSQRFIPVVLPPEQALYFGPDAPKSVVQVREQLAMLEQKHEEWRRTHRQGNVAVTGEFGSGKSTLLTQFAELHDVKVHDIERISTREEAMTFVAGLFGLDPGRSIARLIREIQAQESQVIVLDNLERAFARTVGGYSAILSMARIMSETDRSHFWVTGCDMPSWTFLQRVHSLDRFFAQRVILGGWNAEQLQAAILKRCKAAGIEVSFGALASSDPETFANEVVKTEQGYFRYLEEFTDGSLAAALWYWTASLAEVPGDKALAVRLFDRSHASQLITLNDKERFLLNAVVQQGDPRLFDLALAVNASREECATLVDLLSDIGILVTDGEHVWLAPQWTPLVVRHLADSNLLVV